MWLEYTKRYSIHYHDNSLTIYDKKMNDHLPVTITGEDAEEAKSRLTTISLMTNDREELFKEVDALCENIRELAKLRRD